MRESGGVDPYIINAGITVPRLPTHTHTLETKERAEGVQQLVLSAHQVHADGAADLVEPGPFLRTAFPGKVFTVMVFALFMLQLCWK